MRARQASHQVTHWLAFCFSFRDNISHSLGWPLTAADFRQAPAPLPLPPLAGITDASYCA